MAEGSVLADAGFLKEVFDAIPAMLLVVDQDVRIQHLNATASGGLGLELAGVYNKRGGEALRCVHSFETAGGCGCAEACKDCVIRNSVRMATEGGKTFRKGTRMEFQNGGQKTEIHILTSASPFAWDGKAFVLLTLENVSELIQLRSLLPICMHCKKIRDDAGYWKEIDGYLNARLDVDFSHSLCTECMDKFYPAAD